MKTRKISLNISLVTLGLTFLLFLNITTTNAQGPNAPEAASFEPVDATDMVNLVTGNLSYVLPLLNVPSPEGGYPISLSYHAGIAMEQEASWVGLGWSINPGSINRAVNGYPDDWGKTNYSEFFYDKGWTENYYGLSLGVQVTDAVSVGLGLSWGSNQSLGGFVSASVGFGEGGSKGSIGFRAGTNGVSINGGLKGFSASLGTSGVGIGYSKSGVGVNLNWSPSNGIAGGFSITQGTGSEGKALNGDKYNKTASVGINFSSNSISINGSANGFGAGTTNYTNSDGGEYDVNTSSTSFTIPIYMFYIGWSHTKIQRSLFKYDNLYTSGMLYPVEANKSQANGIVYSNKMEGNHFMDVNVMQPFSNSSNADDLIDNANRHNINNLILANYDNYNVSAQGLSGKLNPYTYKELILSARGRGEQNNDNEYVTYLNKSHDFYTSIASATGNTPNEIDKKYFTFSNTYNSYLKLNRSNFSNQNSNSSDSENILSKYTTTDNNSNGFINGKRKKEGNHITTFTNKEIRQGNLNSFIEAKEESSTSNLLDRNNTEVFLDEGIGAYQITTMDGKTYHYSLPVCQFESFYKNYPSHKPNGDVNNSEDDNFFEIQKTKPYATHWLLTAITGPDYYDKNGNGKVDEADYGYWVEFDYGKWSDGFIWKTPREEVVDENDNTKKTTAYSWGRKQIYYLDAIKTRTHTALFVKDIKKDSKSDISVNRYKQKIQNEIFDYNKHPLKFSAGISKYESTNYEGLKFINYYDIENNTNITYYYDKFKKYYSRKTSSKYIDFTEVKSLYLKSIIIVKNELLSNNIKQISTSFSNLVNDNFFAGHIKERSSIFEYKFKYSIPPNADVNKSLYGYLHTTGFAIEGNDYSSTIEKNNIKSQISNNILDIKDIEGLNLESQAIQVIDFEHDYSLADKAPNATTGRLTLKAVNFKGKYGIQLVPPYKFEYETPWRDYNKDNIDAWGYYKTNPETWSLNKITTPTGGKINIEYGKDEYVAEAAFSEEKEFSDIISVNGNSTEMEMTFNSNIVDVNSHFEIGRFYRVTYTYHDCGREDWYTGDVDCNIQNRDKNFEVIGKGSNWVRIKIGNDNLSIFDPTNQSCGQEGECVDNVKIYGTKNGFSSPVQGGGIVTNSITINDGVKDIARTEYNYKRGVTSYVPSKEPKGIPYVSELPAPMVLYGEVEMNTKDGNGNYLGSTVYEFETLEPRKEETGYIFSLGEAFRVKENQNQTFENGKVIANKYTIESKLGNIGRLKSVKSFNAENQLLNKTENHYKVDLDNDLEIGVTQESFKSYKRYRKDLNNDNDFFDPNEETFYVSATSKINYPSVLESVTTSQGNFEVTKYFDKHDFLTGQVLETRTYASDGVAFKSKIVPAYQRYSEMGSKIDNPDNANMLTQTAASYTYLLNEDPNASQEDKETVIGVGITTWNNLWGYRNYNGQESVPSNSDTYKVWRKHQSFIWKGDIDSEGKYLGFNEMNDDEFEWGLGIAQTNSDWQQVSEVTRYDHYSMTLETKDINDNYASTKMGDNNSKVIAVANAAYREMYYSGAEYEIMGAEGSSIGYFDGEVKFSGTRMPKTETDIPHTGNYYLQTPYGQNAFEVNIPTRADRDTYRKKRFKVSVWVKKGQELNVGIKVNNGSAQSFNTDETILAGDWSLLNGYIDITDAASSIAITSTNGTIDLDDFRLHPITSSMTSYVYNEFDEVTFIMGANGLSTCYVYDNAGRLKETWVEVLDNDAAGIIGGFKRVSKNSYNYKND
ncbi:hypothetical protein [Polaribacter porphyrae]|uniref:Uncharacterized protein n=1 Tax=Polaribacter porphyrae TaxID=1137780 RepID=A0A2S7WRS1_9FLAO|nr:hypothetical protein [Polaribacter porphyrae]PQJ80298.1 hypothetical protein BTO18_14420 [Polaribacter porphyrae]